MTFNDFVGLLGTTFIFSMIMFEIITGIFSIIDTIWKR